MKMQTADTGSRTGPDGLWHKGLTATGTSSVTGNHGDPSKSGKLSACQTVEMGFIQDCKSQHTFGSKRWNGMNHNLQGRKREQDRGWVGETQAPSGQRLNTD